MYKGEFTSNEITGHGHYTWPDESTYRGMVKNGLRHGQGVYKNDQEGIEYEGEWVDGMRHGHGVLKYKNGSVYEGQWERGMKWGQGKMTYSSGNYYEGQWANNKRNGHGTMHWLTTQEKYEGNWEDNFQSGFGAHIWLDGSTDNKLLRNRYVGYWKLGQRHGNGVFYYSNGSRYEGEWVENYKHGHGTFTFEDGTQYIGPFENDRMIARQIEYGTHTEMVEEKPKKKNKDDSKSNEKKDPKNSTAKSKPDVKNTTQGSKEKATTGGDKTQTSSKFNPGSKVKKEVEENPFKKLIDISDLMEFESNQGETLKEIQNILLRHNSELKQWYKSYSRKFEVHKCEESFAMTMKQVWRFLRDTRLISANSTIAQFNRVYFQGSKNDFMMLNSDDKAKFDLFYGNKAAQSQKMTTPPM